MKVNWDKVKNIAIAVIVIGLVAFIIKLQWDAQNREDALNQRMIEMKQLQDGIIRAQSKYVSKDDLDDFAKKIDINLSVIRKDLDKFGADIKGINHVLARSTGRKGSNIPSTGTKPRPVDPEDPDKPHPLQCSDVEGCYLDTYGYNNNSQSLGLTEPFSNGSEVPFGTVTFEAWKKEPWSVDQPPREYHVATVLGQDEEGRHYVHNKFQIGVDGKRYEVPIEQSELQEVYPEPEFRWDPHLNLGLDVGASIATSPDPDESAATAEVVPNLQVTLFSYGETKKNPDWTFLGLGVGFETRRTNLGILVSPSNYNIGKPLPLMDNLYVGPQVGVDMSGNVFVGGGLRVGL